MSAPASEQTARRAAIYDDWQCHITLPAQRQFNVSRIPPASSRRPGWRCCICRYCQMLPRCTSTAGWQTTGAPPSGRSPASRLACWYRSGASWSPHRSVSHQQQEGHGAGLAARMCLVTRRPTMFCILLAMLRVTSAVLPPAPQVMSQNVGP